MSDDVRKCRFLAIVVEGKVNERSEIVFGNESDGDSCLSETPVIETVSICGYYWRAGSKWAVPDECRD